MSTDSYKQFARFPNSNTVFLDGYSQIGDSVGTIGFTTLSKGTLSRVSAGTYNFVLDQPFFLCLAVKPVVFNSGSRLGYESEVIFANPTGTANNQGAAKTIQFVFLNGTTPTDLPNGAGFGLSMVFKDSNLKVGA
jgi:hypothetical protein